MATTTQKRPHGAALRDALDFRSVFDRCYERWEFAGSLRRGKPDVADIEHVIIPRIGRTGGGLFPGVDERPFNLLWRMLDEYVAQGVLAKHTYIVNRADGTTEEQNRWGERYRGVDFRGFNHEIFLADADNWGCQLLIRTGPAEFSERVVTRIKQGGMYRQQDGYLVHVSSGERVPVKDERAYLKIAGLDYVEPEDRR